MIFLVSVPVLSEHTTFTQPNEHNDNYYSRGSPWQPNVSTTGSFLTIACLRAILITPRANVTVTTIGRPSGIAATAKLLKNEYFWSYITLNQRIVLPYSYSEHTQYVSALNPTE